MKILVLNSGSSSIKYKMLDMQKELLLADGLVERIGENNGKVCHKRYHKDATVSETLLEQAIVDHNQGIKTAVSLLTDAHTGVIDGQNDITAIGHRVVHGGEMFRQSTLIDARVIENVEACIPLAPLHNPGCLAGIRTAIALFPQTPQVAVFDTAYHQSIPPHAYHYALPRRFYEEYGIRRYGFHGTSHQYVAGEACRLLGKTLDSTNLITLHLGNGASITAIANGQSVDTSMGMTPLAGVIMGTRCGDIDPAIVSLVAEQQGMALAEVMEILSKESGLKGICGENDLRDIHRQSAAGNARSKLALEMLVYRYRQYVGAYLAVLGNVDAIVFTAGIGENDTVVRQRVCDGLEALGICIDADLNNTWRGAPGAINRTDSPIKILVIPTNEELEIARQTVAVIGSPTED